MPIMATENHNIGSLAFCLGDKDFTNVLATYVRFQEAGFSKDMLCGSTGRQAVQECLSCLLNKFYGFWGRIICTIDIHYCGSSTFHVGSPRSIFPRIR